MAAPIRDRLRSRLAHFGFLIARPMTLGVRAVVIDREEGVLLVRHGYVSGWHFPGGGVEVGETCMEALARELEEEANVALEAPPLLHGVFFNARPSRRDDWVLRNRPCSNGGPSMATIASSSSSRAIASTQVSPGSTPPPGKCQPET